MTRRDEKQQSMWTCHAANQARFFHRPLFACLPPTRQHPATIFAANQDAPINKNSKSSNPKSLKQHTPAKPIPLCCFCFCPVRDIGRFIILICRYLPHRSKSRFFSTRFSFSWSYIFCFRFSSSDSAFIFSRLPHLLGPFCSCHDQTDIWVTVNEFFCNIDRQEEWFIRFETKLGKDEKIVLRTCLKSRLRAYFISGSPFEN